jgi:AP-1 complex subunit mu
MARNYRGDVEMNSIEKFMPLLMEQEDEGRASPVIQKDDISYVFIKHTNIFSMFQLFSIDFRIFYRIYLLILVVALCKNNANAAMVLSFLYKCVETFISYFKDLEV